MHVARATSGANAIEAAFELIQTLKRLESGWNDEKDRHPHWAGHHHPINLNIGRIEGGDWASSVPAWCVFDVRIAVYPGDDLALRRAEIESCLRDAASANPFLANAPPEIVFDGFQAEGYVLPEGEAAEATLAASHRRVFANNIDRVASTGTTDARFFGLYGKIPALVYGPVAQNIHGFDERVSLESLRRNTQAIALFVADWCGLTPA